MKRIIAMLILSAILVSSIGCNQLSQGSKETASEANGTDNTDKRREFCGKWIMLYAENSGNTVSVDNLKQSGIIKNDQICSFILQEDGKMIMGKEVGTWYVVSETVLLLDETIFHLDKGMLYFTAKEVNFYYQKETAQDSESDRETKNNTVAGLRKEFKDAMDSYEAFCDEYCSFMTQYMQNPTDLSLLSRYAGMLSKYQKLSEDFEKWEQQDLNAAEMKYYLEVQSRVAKKMMDIVL